MGKVWELTKKFGVALVESTEKQNNQNKHVKSQKQAVKEAKHNIAPNTCPMCKNAAQWKLVGNPKQGFSVGKAAAGAVLLGPIGVAGGALGKKKQSFACGSCGFNHVYDK